MASDDSEIIEEGTVGMLGGVRVPMGNMTIKEYTLPDGNTASGLVCRLALPEREGGAVEVGMSSIVAVEGARWQVVDIQKPAGKPGSVTLERIDG